MRAHTHDMLAPALDLSTRILVVDDDPGIRELVARFLAEHGYLVDQAEDAAAMRMRMAAARPDLVVLDLMMPGEDGLSVLRSLGSDRPRVIMMSAIGSDVDRIVGLEMGADDYLPKPSNPRELLARIRAVLRRDSGTAPAAPPVATERYRFDGWSMDATARVLTDPAGVVVNLSDGEFRLLMAFVRNPVRVLTRDQLLDLSRGAGAEHFDRAIDVQISRLRRKLLGDGGADPIRTIRNEGYLFSPAVGRG